MGSYRCSAKYFHGNDLRPVRFEPDSNADCRVLSVNAYLTRKVHIFLYGWQLRSILSENWDLIHCWEEPYIFAGGEVAWFAKSKTPLVFRTAQSINKRYPQPFRWIEQYSMRRAAGWICSGSLVAKTLSSRLGYDKPMAKSLWGLI